MMLVQLAVYYCLILHGICLRSVLHFYPQNLLCVDSFWETWNSVENGMCIGTSDVILLLVELLSFLPGLVKHKHTLVSVSMNSYILSVTPSGHVSRGNLTHNPLYGYSNLTLLSTPKARPANYRKYVLLGIEKTDSHSNL